MRNLKPEGIYHNDRYVPGVRAGNMIYTAGRIPVDPDGNIVSPGDAAAQTAQIMEDMIRILSEGDATLNDVVLVRTYFLDPDDMPVIHATRQRYMGEHRPPHTGIPMNSPAWVENGIRLEIEVVAACSSSA